MTTATNTSATPGSKPAYSRRTLRKLGREKRSTKLRAEPEFRKAFFEGKSKRSNDRKTAYRKRHEKK
jgi:hypothetical protein